MFQPSKPELKGLAQRKDPKQTNGYEKPIGKLSLWKYTPDKQSTTGKPQPTYRGYIEISGEKLSVSLWANP